MNLQFNPNIFKTSHPFSVIIGTFTGVIISWKFLNSVEIVLKLGLIFLLAQFLTGFMNDFLDFDSDLQFQPLKITSRGGITRNEIKYAIKVNILLLVVSTLILIPFDLSLIVFLGTIVAQSYNIKLKDTPLSGIVFVISFGLMALIPYIIKNGYSDNELPVTFIISGLILAIIAHFVNDLVDYEIDIKRNSKSMVVTFGQSFSIVITVALLLFLAYLQNNVIILGIILTVIGIVIGGIKNSSYKIRELVYYFVALLSLLILLILPVE